jgi:hypothetical protein
MRYNGTSKTMIPYGTKRRIRKFLFLPKFIWVSETKNFVYRWLEYASIEQEYTYWEALIPECSHTMTVRGWRDRKWID